MRRRALLGAALVVVVILLIAVPRTREYEKDLTGFWEAPPEFLEDTGLAKMCLYISPREDGERQGRLLMVGSGGEALSNQDVQISYGGALARGWSALKAHFRHAPRYYIKRVNIAYDEDTIMPESMSLAFSPAENLLVLYSEGKAYACLVKNSEASIEADRLWN